MNTKTKILIFTLIGAGLGYAYFQYFGCETNCTLKSDWRITTFYGSFVGFVLALPSRKKQK